MAAFEPIAPTVADFNACLAESAKRVATGCGLVEYGDRGQGAPLVCVHGSPGDFVEGLLMAESSGSTGSGSSPRPAQATGERLWPPDGPASSRPTPSPHCSKPWDWAGCQSWVPPAGGPASYALAGRHPDRVSCLLEVDSLCLPLPPNRLERLSWSSRPLVALQLWLVDHFPGRMLKMAGGRGNPDPQEAAARVALLRSLMQSASDWPRMRVGYDNDEAEFAALGDLPLAQIACPTMIVHGQADRSVPTVHAEPAHAAITDSQLRWLPDGPHIAFFVDPNAQRDALAWLRRHALT